MSASIHAHCFHPGTDNFGAPLVLLHGSGGNETDLVPLASELAPKAAKLGIRGTVAIEEGYAFFHRFPDRRVDEADIQAKAPALAEFIQASRSRYNFVGQPMAIGFSNAGRLSEGRPKLDQKTEDEAARPSQPFRRALEGGHPGSTPVK